jgi:hypothetical protein
MEIYRELHNGWLIVVFQEVHQWLFECHKPENDPYTAINCYENQESALCAAKKYIALESIRSAFSDDWP